MESLPKRKYIRLQKFDYSSKGAYFITICTANRNPILSKVIKRPHEEPQRDLRLSVGEGLAPPEYFTELTLCGDVVKKQLQSIEERFDGVIVDDFIIMPDHIHLIIFLLNNTGGASPSPTISDIICAFKSLTTRICKKNYNVEKLFQRSFADHIIRDKEDYETRKKYIHENPLRWYYKYLNVKN